LIKLRYVIPTIGKVKICFGGYPETFYKILVKAGEVERLKSLLHLGVLHEIFPGMNHTRWDYTITMLYFIQQFSKAGLKGLSPAKKVGEVWLSGRDMLQILALGANIGHLPGTFAVEKGVMRCLITNKNLAKKVIKGASLSRKFGIEKVDYTNLNKLFVLVKLQSWLDTNIDLNEDRKVIRAAKILFEDLVVGEPKTEHRRKILDRFNLCRRASYQLLDCLYVNLPVRVDYAGFAKRLLEFFSQVERWEAIQALIDSYTRVIYHQIYHSKKSRELVVLWAEQACRLLEVSDKPLARLKEWLTYSRLGDISEKLPGNKYELLFSVALPFKFGPNFLIETFREEHTEKIEEEFSELIQDTKALILYVPGLKDPVVEEAAIGDLYLDVFVAKKCSNFTNIKTLLKILIWTKRKFGGDWGSGILVKGALENLLQRLPDRRDFTVSIDIAPDDFFKEGASSFIPDDRVNIFAAGEKKDALAIFRRKVDQTWDSSKKKQFHECKVLKELVKKRWIKPQRGLACYHVIVPGRIKFVHRSNGTEKCEFDGALLQIAAKGMNISRGTLFLLEAKSGKSTSRSEAGKLLRFKLKEKLGIKPKSVRRFQGRSAYAKVILI
jgi:hypothetical protein